MEILRYVPTGVCAKTIEIEIEGRVIKKIEIVGGCKGNRMGIARLVEGMAVEEVIKKLEGIECQNATSCPDQLAQALKTMFRED